MLGRRVEEIGDITEPGDYWYDPDGSFATDGKPAIFFMLPNAKPNGPAHRSLHHVTEPPHTFRHCDDGSIEVRASIGAVRIETVDGPGGRYTWHGYLDEGHTWREC